MKKDDVKEIKSQDGVVVLKYFDTFIKIKPVEVDTEANPDKITNPWLAWRIQLSRKEFLYKNPRLQAGCPSDSCLVASDQGFINRIQDIKVNRGHRAPPSLNCQPC